MCSETKEVTISHEKKQVENEIQKLLEQDVTEPVTSSPKWLYPLVCVSRRRMGMYACVNTCVKLTLQLLEIITQLPLK